MLEKNSKVSVLTKMIGIGDEKAPQLIVPQNSLTNFHARMGLTEKSINMATNGEGQTQSISCPHCQNMAKNFLYLESLIRANGSPKNKCSLCSSTLRYVEYVNKSILDVFAKNASIIEAAQKYSTSKPRFRMPKMMSRVSRLAGGGKKAAPSSNESDTGTATSSTKTSKNSKKIQPKATESSVIKTTVLKPKQSKATDAASKETKVGPIKSTKQRSQSTLKTSKVTGSRISTRSADRLSVRSSKIKKIKVSKSKKNIHLATPMNMKKNNIKVKSKRGITLRENAA